MKTDNYIQGRYLAEITKGKLTLSCTYQAMEYNGGIQRLYPIWSRPNIRWWNTAFRYMAGASTSKAEMGGQTPDINGALDQLKSGTNWPSG